MALGMAKDDVSVLENLIKYLNRWESTKNGKS